MLSDRFESLCPIVRHHVAFALCLWASCASPVRAVGPAWIAEMSSQEGHAARADAIEVWLPAGEFATVAVHEAETIDVEAPPNVRADEFVVWYETREIFRNRPESRREAIPYYLPSRKWLKPDKEHPSWGVRLFARAPGVHVVPIRCPGNTVTVTLRVTAGVPPSDCGFGFYGNYQAYSYGGQEPLYLKHMRDYGCNTFTAYSWTADGSDLVRQMETAARVGLLDKRFGILVLPTSPPGTLIPRAVEAGRDSEAWPELIAYNHDEPRRDQEDSVRAASRTVHDAGLRTGTAMGAASAFLMGDCLDIWIVHMNVVNDTLRELCRRQDAEWWVYNCNLRGTNAPLHRYYTGAWTWKVRPKVNLLWAYQHGGTSLVHKDGTWAPGRAWEHALGAPDGPMSTVGLEGVRDGIIDYRVLRRLEQLVAAHPRHEKVPEIAHWLQSITDRVDTQFWPLGRDPGYAEEFWDVPDTAVPPIDGARMRRKALQYMLVMEQDIDR